MKKAFVSLGNVVDRRSFPLVAKGRRYISLGCFPFLVMVWWRRWSEWINGTASQCQTCCSPTKLGLWDAWKHREPPHRLELQASNDHTKGAAKAHTQQAGAPPPTPRWGTIFSRCIHNAWAEVRRGFSHHSKTLCFFFWNDLGTLFSHPFHPLLL